LGLADGIVDIVETGSTLKENGLEVVTCNNLSAMARKEIRPIRARKSKTALADIKVNNFIKRISVFNNSILAYNAEYYQN